MSRLAAFGGAALAMLGVGLLWNMADILFSAHMAQHLLLIALAAPLLALGGAEVKMPPLAGWGLFVAVFVFWHWPAAFQWAAGGIPDAIVRVGHHLGGGRLLLERGIGTQPRE